MADDKRRKKKRGRSRLFWSCFRSFVTDERSSSYDKLDDRNSKNGRLGTPVVIAVSNCKEKEYGADVNLVNGGVADGDRFAKRSSPPRRMSRVLKSVLFDSLMVKKIRGSSFKSSIASDTSDLFLSSEKIGKKSDYSNACGRECTETDVSCSPRSNLFSSSSRTTSSNYTSSSSNSRSSSDQKSPSQIDLVDFSHPMSSNLSNSKKPNPINSSSQSDSLNFRRQDSSISLPLAKPKPTSSISQSLLYQKGLFQHDLLDSTKPNPDRIKSGGNSLNIHWCLFLLLSLVVLVIWGRIFSILCTSILFYFVPCRRIKRVNSVTNAVKFVDIDSEQYKKRVIMAGLLDRTRNPLR